MTDDPNRTYVPDRRRAPRVSGRFAVEILPERPRKGVAVVPPLSSTIIPIKNVSTLGMYFLSESRKQVGSKFNFRILFDDKTRHDPMIVFGGSAKVLRCEDAASASQQCFGVAAKIEKIKQPKGTPPLSKIALFPKPTLPKP